MGYTRIETERAGRRVLAMPEFDSGAIDKVPDARGELTAQRRVKESERQARTNPPMSEPTESI
jgi:hypothetical protein